MCGKDSRRTWVITRLGQMRCREHGVESICPHNRMILKELFGGEGASDNTVWGVEIRMDEDGIPDEIPLDEGQDVSGGEVEGAEYRLVWFPKPKWVLHGVPEDDPVSSISMTFVTECPVCEKKWKLSETSCIRFTKTLVESQARQTLCGSQYDYRIAVADLTDWELTGVGVAVTNHWLISSLLNFYSLPLYANGVSVGELTSVMQRT